MDKRFMRRALELAKRGEGWTNPNPLVGAVIVRDGRIIGEGYHERFGGPHAEVRALEAASAEAEGSDLYVNLEPCAHWGKTPPCVARIISAKIKRVIVAVRDPNPLVNGEGIARLQEAGIEVVLGVLEEEAKKLNEPFFKFITTGRPFVLLKLALTLDGKIATRTGDSKWISGERSRELVHRLRNRYAAVLVGINTVLRDNPQLTVRREGTRTKDPLRMILDSRGRIPLEATVLNLDSEAPTVVATTERMPKEKEEALFAGGARVWRLGSRDGKVDLNGLITKLGEEGIDSLLVEGGATVAAAFLEAGLVDKVVFFIAPKIVGGPGITIGGEGVERIAEAWQLKNISVRMLDGDVVYEGYLR
jgi:diaminohydroxyphosphoribosylaminopyrimidine deaminase/5-amino-6-(5-phosphoribosylamino)uracil reductase